jgi:hypothetical protein
MIYPRGTRGAEVRHRSVIEQSQHGFMLRRTIQLPSSSHRLEPQRSKRSLCRWKTSPGRSEGVVMQFNNFGKRARP